MAYKILIADDEEDILRMLKDYFELSGYLVYTADSGCSAIERIAVNPDIILLDINMPDMDGLSVCKRIRNHVNVPIVFLTAKVEEQDKINGFLLGGDDYITKPFSLEELGARVAAHLRREGRQKGTQKVRIAGELLIEYDTRRVFWGEKEIDLTRTEFDIVEILSLHKGQVFDKETIYEKLWGFDKDGSSNIITEHIRRIRTKFGRYCQKDVIETVWGVGYRWIM
ncbi:response regulator transcription factor [Anaerocolumna xylanovorans]|uniref:Stage 0 sporulation protein A homolog n=1 Tax=Anaerocolumna xylanovorans DSM 12503 TaxID=1121345 RepID=A0A1M7YKZ7_9FIRM|nr:response regulator transcription factor [Anaerocolumna xylanovorans]SHO53256.1 DNA-binding response regulator, OmpR family, contains REC and winged-helix (wHTH) domain [Anaerocolumna xylanovorans DSM 12503]